MAQGNQNTQKADSNPIKQIQLTEITTPTTLPLHEHNARRRRSVVAPGPGKGKEHHSAPHKPGAAPGAPNGLLHTYSQFSPQTPLHE